MDENDGIDWEGVQRAVQESQVEMDDDHPDFLDDLEIVQTNIEHLAEDHNFGVDLFQHACSLLDARYD